MLNRLLPLLATGGLALFLASCQTLSQEECLAADWQVIGEQDGAQGHEPQDRFSKHVQACEKAGIVPDQTLWYEGYQRGLVRYCTPLNGLSQGQAGRQYHNVCSGSADTDFRRGYELGLREHRITSRIRSLESSISSSRARIDTLEDKLASGKGNERELTNDIRNNRSNIRRYNREIGELEFDLGRVRREIEVFRQDPSYTPLTY